MEALWMHGYCATENLLYNNFDFSEHFLDFIYILYTLFIHVIKKQVQNDQPFEIRS